MAEKNFTDFPEHIWQQILESLDQEIAQGNARAANLNPTTPQERRAVAAYQSDAQKARQLKDSFLAERKQRI